MSDQTLQPDDVEVASALRNGLALVPVPRLGAEFDAAVLAATSRPAISWYAVRSSLRAVMVGGACSAAISFVLLQAFLQMPVPPTTAQPAASRPSIALDRTLDAPSLRGLPIMGALGSAQWLAAPSPPSTPLATPAPTHPGAIRGQRGVDGAQAPSAGPPARHLVSPSMSEASPGPVATA